MPGRRILIAAVTFELLAVVLVLAAHATRTDPAPFEGRSGTIEDLLDQFSTPAGPEFTSAGIAMLALAAVAALVGALLFLTDFRRR